MCRYLGNNSHLLSNFNFPAPCLNTGVTSRLIDLDTATPLTFNFRDSRNTSKIHKFKVAYANHTATDKSNSSWRFPKKFLVIILST